MGAVYTIKAFAVMVLGGLGNTWGALVGSFILGMLENISIGLDLGSWSLPAGYKDAFAYACILLVLLFRPQGLFGRPQRGV
jgi:branched-chain amino acid transport system permease protein